MQNLKISFNILLYVFYLLYIKQYLLLFYRYQCPFCYATGENAHTRRYCPKNPNKMCFMKGGEQLVIKQNLQ